MARQSVPGLWTMEGSWSSSVRDVRSVKPILQALVDAGQAKYAELRINDPEDLRHQLKRWGQVQHERFNIDGWTCSSWAKSSPRSTCPRGSCTSARAPCSISGL